MTRALEAIVATRRALIAIAHQGAAESRAHAREALEALPPGVGAVSSSRKAIAREKLQAILRGQDEWSRARAREALAALDGSAAAPSPKPGTVAFAREKLQALLDVTADAKLKARVRKALAALSVASEPSTLEQRRRASRSGTRAARSRRG